MIMHTPSLASPLLSTLFAPPLSFSLSKFFVFLLFLSYFTSFLPSFPLMNTSIHTPYSLLPLPSSLSTSSLFRNPSTSFLSPPQNTSFPSFSSSSSSSLLIISLLHLHRNKWIVTLLPPLCTATTLPLLHLLPPTPPPSTYSTSFHSTRPLC